MGIPMLIKMHDSQSIKMHDLSQFIYKKWYKCANKSMSNIQITKTYLYSLHDNHLSIFRLKWLT